MISWISLISLLQVDISQRLYLLISSFLARQQTLSVEHLALDNHFLRVNSLKAKATEVAIPLTDLNKQDDILKDQESTLQQCITSLKEKLATVEKALAQISEERVSLQTQF